MEDKKNEGRLEVNISAEVADGKYSNLVAIAFSQSEFIVDFIRILPAANKADVKSRIILTPDTAKKMLFALQDSIAKFEHQVGKIEVRDGSKGPMLPPMFGAGEA